MRPFGPVTPRAERRHLVDRAWQRYVRDRALNPPGGGKGVGCSFPRARDSHRIDPGITRPGGRGLTTDALADRRERDEVFRLATPILADFARRLGLHETVLAYVDAEGWMLSLEGDRGMVEQVGEIDFRPGAHWAEEVAGTNGPGTALVERRPVEVFASEHFVAAWHPWSCAAAPVLAPGDPAPVGVVDITAPWEVQRRHALVIANAIARAIEERLHAAIGVRDEVVRYAFRAAQVAGDALVAIDRRGRVIGANDAATRRAIVDAGALTGAARETVAAALRDSARPIDADVEVKTPDGPTFVASPVRYDGTTVGAILRVSRAAPRARAAGACRPTARYALSDIQGRSERLRAALELARTAARTDLPVVISGESGTGKELFAHAVHSAGARQDGPFIAVNCGSIPAQFVETELFGYEPGTFTGARREGNPGRFEDGAGGTLFLDEVSELPVAAQTAFLRVLQEREVVRLGGSTPRPLDVRVIAASNKSLEEEVRAGRFRRDLYFRLSVLSISIPPLRDRGDDVVLLAQALLVEAEAEVRRRGLALAPDALDALRDHRWPGNVRELKNVILRAAATAAEPLIRAADLQLAAVGIFDPASAPGRSTVPTLRGVVLDSERDALLSALEASAWNVARAAEQLGISRMTLYRRLHRHGISRAPPR
jgi:sigma-54 dependent transcriptional regulator, acetoin dehydrogenase operon transcriptional activator AcoR